MRAQERQCNKANRKFGKNGNAGKVEEARRNLNRKDFYEFGYRPQKTFEGKKKKQQPTSLRMNEIPAAHLQTASSSSIQSYYKWFRAGSCCKCMTGQ